MRKSQTNKESNTSGREKNTSRGSWECDSF